MAKANASQAAVPCANTMLATTIHPPIRPATRFVRYLLLMSTSFGFLRFVPVWAVRLSLTTARRQFVPEANAVRARAQHRRTRRLVPLRARHQSGWTGPPTCCDDDREPLAAHGRASQGTAPVRRSRADLHRRAERRQLPPVWGGVPVVRRGGW